MRKLIFSLIFVLVVGLSISTLSIVLAQQDTGSAPPADQQNPQGQRQRPPQMDPEAMISQMLTRTMEQLKLSDEETTVIKPKIEAIMRARMAQSQERRTLVSSLREAINAKNTDQIKTKLTEIKAKREENKKKNEELEKELTDLLTLDQEALLTVSGIVNGDGAGGFGGFGGPGGPGGPGGQPRGQRQGNNQSSQQSGQGQ